jgi:hypothetical protein
MDTSILHAEIQKYINSQLGVAITKLALQKNPFPEVNWISILNQIAAKSKAKDKLPTYFSTENIVNKNSLGGHQFWLNDKTWTDRMNALFQEYRNG